MIKIEKVVTYGWEAAIRGMRNPKNSWDRSDSNFSDCDQCAFHCQNRYKDKHGCFIENGEDPCEIIGENDMNLMKALASGGPVHAKYRRFITVTLDITAPLYWWKEFDTYKVGTACNSCSTMHKIHAKEFTIDDFSCEHLTPLGMNCLDFNIRTLNYYRTKFVASKDKTMWWQMIQLLPTSYNQKRTVMLNYEVLTNMYEFRHDHKLDEWRQFCEWIESLPYSELITGKEVDAYNG